MARLDVAILGAGIAGLAAALFLGRAGHAVTLFDQFDAPKPLGSGLILQPTGQAVMRRLGLGEAIGRLAAPIHRLHGVDAGSGRAVLDVRYAALSASRCGLGVHRGGLFSTLFDAVLAEGIAIETGSRAVDVDACADGVRVAFAGGRRSARFDLAIDATGARSALTGRALRQTRFRELDYGALWASLDWRDGFASDALSQRYERASVMIGVLPIGRVDSGAQRQAAFFWSVKPADYPALRAGGLGAWKQRIAGLWPQTAPLLDQIGGWEALTLARYGHHTLPVPAGRGIAFIGDSAHSTSPQLGQGANMALLDAAALADAMAAFSEIDQALADYVRRRRFHVGLYQTLSYMLTPFYQSDSHALPWLRDRVVAPLSRLPPAQQILAAMVAGSW